MRRTLEGRNSAGTSHTSSGTDLSGWWRLRRESANLKSVMRRTLAAERLIWDPHRSPDPDACQECGLHYSAQSDEDSRYHAELHDHTVNGVCTRVDTIEHVITHHRQFEILKADKLSLPSSPASGDRLKRAAIIANEETHYDFGVFDQAEIESGEASVFWAREAQTAQLGRIVGLAVVDSQAGPSRILPVTELSLALSGQNFDVGDAIRSDLHGIRFVWVLRKYRRAGLAAALVESALAQSQGGWDGVGFCYPFTAAGARLIYRLAVRASAPSIFVYH